MRLESVVPSKVAEDETPLSTNATSSLTASDKNTENLGMSASSVKNLRSSLRSSTGSSSNTNLRIDLKKSKRGSHLRLNKTVIDESVSQDLVNGKKN